jgi:hypothetical protein
MADSMIIYIIWFGMGVIYSVIFGYFFFNPYRWISIKRKFQGKNFGIINFRSGRSMYPKVVDLSNTALRTKKGLWIIQNDKIYRQTDNETKLVGELKPDNIDFKQGVPMLYMDIDDMLPLQLQGDDKKQESRNPEQVEATISKEIAAAEAEAMRLTRKTLQIIMIIVAVIGVIAVAIGIVNYYTLSALQTVSTANVDMLGKIYTLLETFVKVSVTA